jgi:thiol:disulfide interchange protein
MSQHLRTAPSPLSPRAAAAATRGIRAGGGSRTAAITAALAAAALAAVMAPPAAGFPRPEKARMALQADLPSCGAGETAQVSALVAIEAGWHVNSHTPTFDYLIPTVLEVEAPGGWPRAQLEYPPAEMKRFTFAAVPLSVYDGDVVVKVRLAVPAGTRPGSYPVSARLQYQACNDSQCLPPVTVQSRLSLNVIAGTTGGAGAGTGAGAAAAGSSLDHSAPAMPVGHRTAALNPAAASPAAGPAGGGAPASPASVAAAGSGGNPGTEPAAHPPAAARRPPPANLALMLLLAVVGGLILNAMPCVLPVLSLKVFGLVRSAGHGRREVVRGTLATAAGILVSFWALAAVAVAAQTAGSAVGWGVQFQRPGFVTFLLVVMTLFCLNLWGLFEITLTPSLAQLGAAGAREGLAGHFGSGLFATLMATPCSAPFLGTAIGFALAQPAGIIFGIFTAVGVGLALPYLVLAAAPGAARLLPRPGPWMETLRGVLGFVLSCSVVWLLYVLAAQVSPERLALVEIGLVLVALCTWAHHRAPRGRPAAHAAVVATALAALATVGLAATGGGGAAASRLTAQSGPAGPIHWVAFDRGRAEAIAAGGQLVFVDVTADWCFTCKVNERLILDTPEVAAAFTSHHVLPMRADWTNRNDEIGRFLAEHGRYGIPFYLLYRPGRDAFVFSELPTKAAIIAALDASAATAAGS